MAAGWCHDEPAVVVEGAAQRLSLVGGGHRGVWPISTARAGFGNRQDSGRTPTGLHRVAACVGAGAPLGMVFKGRVATGDIVAHATPPAGDYITTRILWLEGLEEGVNRGIGVDSHARYIYIHGTPYADLLGQPVSAGCVRMDNRHVVALFDRVRVGTLVVILGA